MPRSSKPFKARGGAVRPSSRLSFCSISKKSRRAETGKSRSEISNQCSRRQSLSLFNIPINVDAPESGRNKLRYRAGETHKISEIGDFHRSPPVHQSAGCTAIALDSTSISMKFPPVFCRNRQFLDPDEQASILVGPLNNRRATLRVTIQAKNRFRR